MKAQTNESKLKKLIKENDPITNALLVERLWVIIEATAKELKENPQTFSTFITTPAQYQRLCDNVQKHLS